AGEGLPKSPNPFIHHLALVVTARDQLVYSCPTLLGSQRLLVANAARRWRAAQVVEFLHPPSGDGGYRKR
ncbi:MAG: hypothetical protein ACK56R_04130, partial [Pirellulaceae bacterium]